MRSFNPQNNAWDDVLFSKGLHNKVPQTRWLRTTEANFLTDLKARSPNTRCQQGPTPSETCKGLSFLASSKSLLVTINPWHSFNSSPKNIKMADKHMKRCSTSYVIRELQMKTMRYHYTPIRMAKTQNTDNTQHWWVRGATGTLTHCWWECRVAQPLWKTARWLLTKVNILWSYDPTIVLIGIFPKEMNT